MMDYGSDYLDICPRCGGILGSCGCSEKDLEIFFVKADRKDGAENGAV